MIFKDLLVVELASVLAGPSVGQFFAEQGAEVVKVENPKTKGDVTRSWKSINENSDDISAYFSTVNWGKQSLALDYSTKEGLDVLYTLLAKADIVIVSFKPGDDKKLKVDYDSLCTINPRLIYGSITGYGEDDPRVGYDAMVQADSGLMYINGDAEGLPTKLPVALVDVLAGHQLKEALLLAYINFLKTGKGQKVSVSLFDTAVSSLANQATNWLVGNEEPQRKGSLHPNIAPYGEVFTTQDEKLILLAVGNDKQFKSLCEQLGLGKLTSDKRFVDNKSRVVHRKELQHELQRVIKSRNCADLINGLNHNNIPGAEIKKVSEALEAFKSNLLSNDTIKGIPTFVGKIENESKLSHFLPPPHFGEHTSSILFQKIGLNQQKIDDLKRLSIIS